MGLCNQLKSKVFRYGTTGYFTYVGINLLTVLGCYILIERVGFDVELKLKQWHLVPEQVDIAGYHDKLRKYLGWYVPGPSLLLAMLCAKALFPVKLPIAIALTPIVNRIVASRFHKIKAVEKVS
eukprot:TRINITY_DN5397_c0_g2_i1.p2 TRINITY_DN5397_c0_g2~~TRINITY_DN5397_c0_g2_i1.p2  ORF type:complete len:124 (-),score=0.38 TRINITY_DN5397_c0_g2_i1:342-713(-)